MFFKIIFSIGLGLFLTACDNETTSPSQDNSSSTKQISSSKTISSSVNPPLSSSIDFSSSSLINPPSSSIESSSSQEMGACIEWNKNSLGQIAKGYDLVSYFDLNPQLGKNEFSAEYQGVTLLFNSQKNLDLFIETPESYLPQYGGYCSRAMASGSRVDIDPLAYEVFEGKLYLQASPSALSSWQSGRAGYIISADENWNKLCIRQ